MTSLIARVIRVMQRPMRTDSATHMLGRVDLPEGPFVADVGFGNQTPTAPLAMRPREEQDTPHEVMRLWPVGEELTLQAKLGEDWESIYRLSPHSRLAVDYEVANWFTATHPASPFVSNLIVARPGPDRTRHTLFNGRVTIRRLRTKGGAVQCWTMMVFRHVLREPVWSLTLTITDLAEALGIPGSQRHKRRAASVLRVNRPPPLRRLSLPTWLPVWCGRSAREAQA